VLPTGGIHSYKFSKIQIEEKKKERGRRGGECVWGGEIYFFQRMGEKQLVKDGIEKCFGFWQISI